MQITNQPHIFTPMMTTPYSHNSHPFNEATIHGMLLVELNEVNLMGFDLEIEITQPNINVMRLSLNIEQLGNVASVDIYSDQSIEKTMVAIRSAVKWLEDAISDNRNYFDTEVSVSIDPSVG